MEQVQKIDAQRKKTTGLYERHNKRRNMLVHYSCRKSIVNSLGDSRYLNINPVSRKEHTD